MRNKWLLLTIVMLGISGVLQACPVGDLNGDCRVDLTDFALMAQNWLCIAVPDIRGMSQTEAQAVLVAAGLGVGTITEEYNLSVAAGHVIGSDPAAGEIVDYGSVIDLYLSKGPEAESMVWVAINDPGVPGRSGFNGEMSKYEITNAQYCDYLNYALTTGDIAVVTDQYGTFVKGAAGSNPGIDYVGLNYHRLNGIGVNRDGAVDGGAAKIDYFEGVFTVADGFEIYPVSWISCYGAMAYAAYFDWRLPTEWEWQAVADYDGSYTYGCGTTINNSLANYLGSTHPYGLTPVGAFGTYGYGVADMSGNVWEWTSSCFWSNCSYGSYVIRGGYWFSDVSYCAVSYREPCSPTTMFGYMGFRVCR